MIRAIFVTIVTFAYIFAVGTLLIIHAALTGNTDALYRASVWGARLAVWLTGASLEVCGCEKIPQHQAVVFMPNHQSNFDAPALSIKLPPILVLAKKEFFRVPLLGRAMRLRGFIPVDRKNRPAAIEAVERAVLALKAGHSFLAFPEGTRSRDGRLQPFKKGVFIMAVKAGAPIVPISISGSSKIMPKGRWVIHPGRVRITIHEPIPTAGFTPEQAAQVSEQVRAAIVSGLAKDEMSLEPGREGTLSA